jgi:predicted alpha-1,6-mannanase (GH76 family)
MIMLVQAKIRNLLLLAFAGSLCMSFSSCLKEKVDAPVTEHPDSTSTVSIPYKERASRVYNDVVKKYFSIPASNLFLESYPAQSGDPKQAYFWPYTGVFTGAVLLKKTGASVDLQKLNEGLEAFWDASRLPAGYQSAPVADGAADRYYDDNGTVGLNLIEAYELTKDVNYLNKAEACLLFTMSGESSDEGGGLFWCEQYRTNNISHPFTIKATNATAFAASLALKVYQYRQKQEYLDFAKRMYQWNMTKMQDPGDKQFWNDISLATHTVNTTKWTYNVGEMLTAACLLYRITQDGAYLSDAKTMARASYDYFTRPVRDLGRFFPDHDPWFNAILFRGYLDLYAIEPAVATEYINTFIKNTDYAWEHARTKEGFFYEDWSGDRLGRYYWVLHQAVMVEVYARISIFKKE